MGRVESSQVGFGPTESDDGSSHVIVFVVEIIDGKRKHAPTTQGELMRRTIYVYRESQLEMPRIPKSS